MDSISSSIDTRVNDATSDLAANLSNTLQKETQTEIDRRMNLLKAEITQESETNLGNFSKSIDQRFSFQDDVGKELSGIATQLEGTLKDFETRLNESDTRITELSNRTDENIEQSKANATRIEQTRLELLAADASSRSSVSKQLSEMEKT